MKLSERLAVLVKLGEHLMGQDEYLEAVMARSLYHNGWFTMENQQAAVKAIASEFLDKKKLEDWASLYFIGEPPLPKTVGMVLAGNLPLVGFHDVLSVFVSGHKSQVKLSDKDKFLLPYLFQLLNRYDERTAHYFDVVEQLSGFEAVIATGSNNSSRYFEAYFGKYPHIIRRNRNGIAVLTGHETPEALHLLGDDIFRFFGLGCRNVSKIYVPEGYDFDPLLTVLHEFRKIILNNKYKNNFDHNYAILILNKASFKANGCILLSENDSLSSPIACLHYSYYSSLAVLEKELQFKKNEIQCVVSQQEFPNVHVIPFGKAQEPGLMDYADGIDTMEFLLAL